MKEDAVSLHSVWQNSREIIAREKTNLDLSQLNESIAAIFCPGPFCYFVIDFYDMSILSPGKNRSCYILTRYCVTLHNEALLLFSRGGCRNCEGKEIGPGKLSTNKLSPCSPLKRSSHCIDENQLQRLCHGFFDSFNTLCFYFGMP